MCGSNKWMHPAFAMEFSQSHWSSDNDECWIIEYDSDFGHSIFIQIPLCSWLRCAGTPFDRRGHFSRCTECGFDDVIDSFDGCNWQNHGRVHCAAFVRTDSANEMGFWFDLRAFRKPDFGYRLHCLPCCLCLSNTFITWWFLAYETRLMHIHFGRCNCMWR